MNFFHNIIFVLIAAVFIGSCSSSGTGSGNGDSRFSLSTSISPDNSGSVSPSSGTFDEGASVTLEANAASGFEFVDWTGDIQSTDNPLSFTIDSDTELTANFRQLAESRYTMNLTISDSLVSIDRQFGQRPDATSDLELGTNNDPIDRESPPLPPKGSLDAFFKSPTGRLIRDFRNSSTQSITWNVQIQAGQGDSLYFNWILFASFFNGSLTLKNDENSIQIDMLSESSFAIDTASVDSLLIEYQLNN